MHGVKVKISLTVIEAEALHTVADSRVNRFNPTWEDRPLRRAVKKLEDALGYVEAARDPRIR